MCEANTRALESEFVEVAWNLENALSKESLACLRPQNGVK